MQQTPAQAYLIIQVGNRWSDILRLQPQQSVQIGRASDCQVVIRDDRVSRHNSVVEPSSGGWRIRDLGSRNGTQVNGKRIDNPLELKQNDIILVGGCSLTFSLSIEGLAGKTGHASRKAAHEDSEHRRSEDSIPHPTIVGRLANSQWSGELLDASKFSKESAQNFSETSRSTGEHSQRWNFFYSLIVDLIRQETPQSASQIAIERLLEQLKIECGGVLGFSFDPSPQPDNEDSAATAISQDESSSTDEDSPSNPNHSAAASMHVFATRQAAGGAYHRPSDFLIHTVTAEQQAILARNVQADQSLSLARASGQRETSSIIVAPLRSLREGKTRVLGVLHLYTTVDQRSLGDEDLELAVGVADNLAIALDRLQENKHLNQSLRLTQQKISDLENQLGYANEIVGSSPEILAVQSQIVRAAPTTATVLIRGESGVGKELVARAIHRASRCADGPLVCVNCAALAPTLLESELFGHEKGSFTGATERKIGKFELANHGTLFLDEIGEMPLELQAKFLRALEGQPFERVGGRESIHVQVRVIAATNRDLEEAVRDKQFRSDLYFRLRVIEILVPPLRERDGDIPVLSQYFFEALRAHAGRRISGIAPDAMELLTRYPWPGNVRELRNALERSIVLGREESISADDLNLSPIVAEPNSPSIVLSSSGKMPVPSQTNPPLTLAELERQHIFAILQYADGNKSKAAQLLGIERSTLDRKLKRYQDFSES